MRQRMLEAICIGVLVVSGLAHGLASHRWHSESPLLAQAVARLERTPLVIGTWRGTARQLDSAELTKAGVAEAFLRSYDSSDRRARVHVLLVCGYPGPVSVHSPEACFPAAGYTLIGVPTRYQAPFSSGARPAEFWKAGFSGGSGLVPAHRTTYWAWNATGAWQAPDQPRWAFASSPILYKLYVSCETIPADEGLESSVCEAFLADLLPALQQTLFPDREPEGPDASRTSAALRLPSTLSWLK